MVLVSKFCANTMKIGELAISTRTPVETIRFYEREGLMLSPSRSGGNFRIYSGEHIERLTFIRRCRSLDMTLDEVRALLLLKDSPAGDCGDVSAVLDAHIGHVDARIMELEVLSGQLARLRARCLEARRAEDCGILKELSRAPSASRVQPAGHVGGAHRHSANRKSPASGKR